MSKYQPLFKDLNKRVSDLLTKEIPSEKQETKVEWKGQADPNVAIETSIVTKPDGSSVGTFAPKYTVKEYGTTFSAEVNTRKELKLEVSMEDYHLAGLKTTLTGQVNHDDKWETFGIEYRHEIGNIAASFDYGKGVGSTVKASAVVGSQGVALGGSVVYLLGNDNSDVKELKTVLSYAADNYDISAFGLMKAAEGKAEEKNQIGANFFHRFHPDWCVGAEAVFDTVPAEAKPYLTVATQYRLQPDSFVKAKFDTAGKLGLAYTQKYNRNVKFNFATTIDTNKLDSKGGSVFGFTLSFND